MSNFDNVYKYIMHTPENTNPAIVKSMFENDNPIYTPEITTESGDVNVIYNGNQIGVLSDNGTLTLNTESKRVEYDIELTYTKPAGAKYTVFTLNDTAEETHSISSAGFFHPIIVNNGNIAYANIPIADTTAVIPAYNVITQHYILSLIISCSTDALDVFVNGSRIEYDNKGERYDIHYDDGNYPESFTVTISDKNV